MRFPKEGTRAWKVLYVIAIIIRPFFVRLNIEGEENIPTTGGCVIACNHTLGADYVLLGYASPRQVYYMAKSEIFAFHPVLAKLVASAGAFPVQRGKGDTQAVDQAVAIDVQRHPVIHQNVKTVRTLAKVLVARPTN